MTQKIVGWEGVCFIPGEGEREANGEINIMTTYTDNTRATPEEAWQDAIKLGEKHLSQWFAIQPITEDATLTSRARKLVTFAIYTTEARE